MNDSVNITSARRLFEITDWEATDLGPPKSWPPELAGVVRMMHAAPLPMCLFAGIEARMIYNDAYAPIAGTRHPGCFGQPLLAAWPEVAEFNGDMLAKVRAGETLSLRDMEFELFRNGADERVYLTLHFSPVPDAEGETVAVLAIVEETTDRVVAQKALLDNEARLELASEGAGLVGHWDWDVDADIVTADANFARLYDVPASEAARGVPIGRFIDAVHPDDRDAIRQQIDAAIAERGELRAQYRVQRPDGEIVWVLALGRISGGDGSGPLRLPGISIDISAQRRAQEALAGSEAKFRAIADSMPQMVWSATPDGLHDYFNARWYEFTGVPEGSTDGERWNDIFHPEDQARARERWRHSLSTGEPYQIEYRLRHHSGQYRWTLGRALPIRNRDGHITRWFGTCTDIHETKIAAEEREVIAQELSHRIKNIFSVLGSIISLTARSRPEARGFADELRARIIALSTAHEFVRPRALESGPGPQSSFHGLVSALLSAYDESGRISIGGTDTPVSAAAATPIALIFHELATNAAKYGALAGDDGKLDITTTLGAGRCVIVWKERLGRDDPAYAAQSAKPGFGARLIDLSVQGQMGGEIRRSFEADGLRVEIDLPEWALRRSAHLASQGNR
jgi:PAS domain S-box-containing protein